MEHLVGSLPAQASTGAMIESVHGIEHLLLTGLAQIAALGEVVAQQPIVVLVEASLPGAVWIGKVHLRLQACVHPCVLGKLLAVVQRQGMAALGMGPEHVDDGLTHRLGLAPLHVLRQCVARAPLGQGHQPCQSTPT